MTRANLSQTDLDIMGNFNSDVVGRIQTKLAEHDSALDTIGAPVTGSPTETKTSGALTLTTLLSRVSVTGAVAFTLADGTTDGQEKIIECTVAASIPVGTLTVTTMDTAGGGASAVFKFTAVGQRLHLQWQGSAWHILRKTRAGAQAVVVGTTVLTGFNMCQVYNLAVTATVHSTTTKGIPDGNVPGEAILINVTTAASIPVGDIAITAANLVESVACTSLANLTDKTMNLQCVWQGAKWQATAFTAGSGTATLS